MADSDVKYFWQHANQLTFLELQGVAYNLQDVAGDTFDITSVSDVMDLIATVANAQSEIIKAAEDAKREAAKVTQ